MGLVTCPDCGKQISQDAPICIGCGRPMGQPRQGTQAPAMEITSQREQPVSPPPFIPTARTEPPVKMPQVSTIAKKKDWSWKSFGLAVLLAIIINIIGAAASGQEPRKNIWWTVMWMYLSIEAWKYWKWKVLLPYPLFAFASIVIGLIMVADNIEKLSLTYLVIKGTLNIGGLIAFYLALNKSKSKHEHV